MELLGLHHVSIFTGKAEKNYEFYTKVLGMRLVKKTVNQDNPASYHLFYSDGQGTPGTEITFFDIPFLGRSHRGVSNISSVSLRVPTTDSLHFWKQRFDEYGIPHGEIVSRAGRDSLAFRDYDDTNVILVADNGEAGVKGGVPWERGGIPLEHAVIGLGPVLLTVADEKPTVQVLTEILGFKNVGEYPSREGGNLPIQVFSMGEGGSGAEVHLETRPDWPKARLGRGGVHHVAFRIPTYEEYDRWAAHIQAAGIPNSGKVDRYYFKAFYFREPNGILFELSTDEPGFTSDEPLDSLGETLALPPFLEPKRKEIEANLRPLHL